MPLLTEMMLPMQNQIRIFLQTETLTNTTRKCICFEDSVAGVQATNTANMVEYRNRRRYLHEAKYILKILHLYGWLL
jgi:beta-phosphoglucomutase-like phosphatase (HAD superfamily)